MLSNNQQIPFTIRTLPSWVSKKQKIKDAKVSKKLINAWDRLQDKNKVLDVFIKYSSSLSDFRYWELLRSVWIISGGKLTELDFLIFFNSKKKHKNWFMTPEEETFLFNLKDKVKVYRACNTGEENGFSWTLSSDYSKEYKLRFKKEKIISKIINRSSIYAYINRNKEQEILIINGSN